MNKKGQIGKLPSIIITLVLIGLITAIGLVVMDKFGNAVKTETTTTNTSFTNGSSVAYAPIVSVTAVYCNGSLTIATGNWSYSGNVISVNAGELRSCTSYTGTWLYRANTTSSRSLDNSVTAVSSITTDWLGIMVIVIIVGVVLTIILASFVSFKRQ